MNEINDSSSLSKLNMFSSHSPVSSFFMITSFELRRIGPITREKINHSYAGKDGIILLYLKHISIGACQGKCGIPTLLELGIVRPNRT